MCGDASVVEVIMGWWNGPRWPRDDDNDDDDKINSKRMTTQKVDTLTIPAMLLKYEIKIVSWHAANDTSTFEGSNATG